MSEKTKKCKYCQSEISKKAKICPNCQKKQGGFPWVPVIVIFIILLVAMGGTTTPKEETSSNSNNSSSVAAPKEIQPESQEEVITYVSVDVSTMVTELKENALKAKETYKGNYFEITGRLSNIDSDGKYISIAPSDEKLSVYTVLCSIKNTDQKSKIIDLKKDDIITIKVKIKDVGEVMGFTADIMEFN